MAARRTCTCTFSECSNEGDLMKVCRGLRCVCEEERGRENRDRDNHWG